MRARRTHEGAYRWTSLESHGLSPEHLCDRSRRRDLVHGVYDEGDWHPVLRCDTAHNQAHLDYLDPQGENYRKEWLNVTAPYNLIHDQLVKRLRREYPVHINRWYAQKGQNR